MVVTFLCRDHLSRPRDELDQGSDREVVEARVAVVVDAGVRR